MKRTNADQARHPIGVVAQRTGLTPDLIRVWERRYEVAEPSRDEGGRRLYTDRDLERFRLLAQATAEGRSIGQLAGLTHEQLEQLVRDDDAARWNASRNRDAGVGADAWTEEAMERTRALDAPGLESVLRRAATFLGAPVFLEFVIAPFFRQIGDGWHRGQVSIAEEHLASGVAQPLLVELRGALRGAPDAPVLVVATPAGERHEIGALLAAAAAAIEGWSVVYLGADLPAEEIVRAAIRSDARAVAVSFVFGALPEATAGELRRLREGLPADVPIIAGGAGLAMLNGEGEASGVIGLESMTELRAYLGKNLRRAAR
jgi:MerR family transcriptional regulator, light-induced transcriptional regulator